MNSEIASRNQQFENPVQREWRLLLRGAWLVFALGCAALFVAALPIAFREHGANVTFVEQNWLGGFSREAAQFLLVASDIVIVVVFYAVATLTLWRKADEHIAWFVAFLFVALGVIIPSPLWTLAFYFPEWYLPVQIIYAFAAIGIINFCYLFPDGRFVPRWTLALAIFWTLWFCGIMLTILATPRAELAAEPSQILVMPFGLNQLAVEFRYLIGLFAVATWVYAQVYRYRKISTLRQQQQTRWAVFGIAAALIVFMAIPLPLVLNSAFREHGVEKFFYETFLVRLGTLAFLLFPIAIGISILRSRLWDLDPIVNRTLVYGALSFIIIALYAFVVGLLATLFQQIGNFIIALIATGLVALLFQPLRERLQRAVNRLMYGERDDPYQALSKFSQRLEMTLAPSAVLPSIVETVAQTLKLPYAAIALKQGEQFEIAAEYGNRNAMVGEKNTLELSLTYQRDEIGKMILAPRSRDETFSDTDLRLLNDLAREAGVAAHAVRLTSDLQKSRERIVTTREEERRRLRRDLHDGLGPSLASITLQLEALRNMMQKNPDAANQLINDLQTQMQTAITDVRRLVYELRPPALDDLGLVPALRQYAARTSQVEGLKITIEVAEPLPPLPAAIEVVTYRIALEAITNVVRHAHASCCVVKLWLDGALHLEITDDGIGIASDRHAGIGLNSMRERAAELGGTFVIEPDSERGTRVTARLPLPD